MGEVRDTQEASYWVDAARTVSAHFSLPLNPYPSCLQLTDMRHILGVPLSKILCFIPEGQETIGIGGRISPVIRGWVGTIFFRS